MHIKMGLLNYVQDDGALEALARCAGEGGIRAFFTVTGERAWSAAGDRLASALRSEGIAVTPCFIGDEYPSWEMRERMLNELKRLGHIDGVLGVGGGRALDAAKLLADADGLPLYLAPTQAAQCASAAPLVAVYHPDGTRNGDVIIRTPIRGTFVDMDVLAAAPPRLLASGIADALAKLAETYSAVLTGGRRTARWSAAVALAGEAAGILTRSAKDALEGERAALGDAIYAALCLTGMLSAMGSDVPSPSLAHNLYAAACDLYPDSPRTALHGEIVGVGVLLTAMVCDIPGMDADALRAFLSDTLRVPVRWSALGYPAGAEDFDRVFAFITERKMPLSEKALCDIKRALKELF